MYVARYDASRCQTPNCTLLLNCGACVLTGQVCSGKGSKLNLKCIQYILCTIMKVITIIQHVHWIPRYKCKFLLTGFSVHTVYYCMVLYIHKPTCISIFSLFSEHFHALLKAAPDWRSENPKEYSEKSRGTPNNKA